MKGKQFAYSFLGTVIRAVVLVILAILLFRLGGKAYEFGFRIFTEEPMSEPPGRDVQITVSKSDGIKEVSKVLEEKGLIRDATLFRIQEKVSLYDGDIHPGIFTLNTSMTAEEMLGILLSTDEEDEDEEEQDQKAPPADMTVLPGVDDADDEGAPADTEETEDAADAEGGEDTPEAAEDGDAGEEAN
ncbi:MAG: endolytic transglycosylase MltG [Lachnospiraceae bacterium]|nr:endolytic transglycosylase MltG [Lachnospiraceae bacterium]